MDISDPPTMPWPRYDALRCKQGSIRRGVKVGEHSLVRIRPTLRVRAEGEIEDRRVAWKARTAAQDLRKGQIVGPDKCQPIVKSLELLLELPTPELSELSGPHHHEHLPGLGQQLQDVIDESQENRWRPRRRSRSRQAARREEIARSTDANRSGVSGKSCCRCLRAKTAAGPATVTMRSGLGRSAKVDRM